MALLAEDHQFSSQDISGHFAGQADMEEQRHLALAQVLNSAWILFHLPSGLIPDLYRWLVIRNFKCST